MDDDDSDPWDEVSDAEEDGCGPEDGEPLDVWPEAAVLLSWGPEDPPMVLVDVELGGAALVAASVDAPPEEDAEALEEEGRALLAAWDEPEA